MEANTKVFGLKALSNVAQNYEVPAGMRACSIRVKSEVKGKAVKGREGKVSQYCDLPVITANFVQLFITHDKGLELVRGYIENLQDEKVKQVYLEHSRSPTEVDLAMESLFEIGALVSTTVRCTKESIGAWFDSHKNAIALFIAERQGLDATTAGFWNADSGARCLAIAGNYKEHFQNLAARDVSYAEGIKEKLETVAVAVMEGTALEEKMLAKLSSAVVKSVDDLGL